MKTYSLNLLLSVRSTGRTEVGESSNNSEFVHSSRHVVFNNLYFRGNENDCKKQLLKQNEPHWQEISALSIGLGMLAIFGVPVI